jgi:hypothetical protein
MKRVEQKPNDTLKERTRQYLSTKGRELQDTKRMSSKEGHIELGNLQKLKRVKRKTKMYRELEGKKRLKYNRIINRKYVSRKVKKGDCRMDLVRTPLDKPPLQRIGKNQPYKCM